jgi:nitrate/nitrite transport system substrate-binding protein
MKTTHSTAADGSADGRRSPLDRRGFLSTTLASLGSAALLGCSSESSATSGSVATKGIPLVVPAGEAPETPDLKVGIIALTDCSPLVIAAEKGFFAKYGLRVTIAKQASWAAIRDALSTGDIQATHMLLGMPIASTLGLLGSPKKPMIAP